MQAYDKHKPKNNNIPRSIHAIYLQAESNLQGDHQVMDLETEKMTWRAKYEKYCMTRMVIERVETLEHQQGYENLKICNCKHKEMVLTDIDPLEGVSPANKELTEEDEDYVDLPPINDVINLDPEVENPEVDQGVNLEKVAELDDAEDVLDGNDNIPETEPEEEGNNDKNEPEAGPDECITKKTS